MVDKHVRSLLKKAETSASMLDDNSVETVVCDECGDRHFAYEECRCFSGDWPGDQYEGVDQNDVN